MRQKKTFIFSVLAVLIILFSAVSIQYLTGGEMGASADFIPWFSVDVPYAYVNLYDAGGNNTMSWDGAYVQGVVNFTLTPDAIDLRGANAQIEFYQLHFYSNKGSIVNMTYSVAVSGRVTDPDLPVGFDYAITGSTGEGVYTFVDGTIYDGKAVFGAGGGCVVICNNMPESPLLNNYTLAVLSNYIADYNGEQALQTLTDLRNAQTIYLDVIRIGSVLYKGNSTSDATITTIINEGVLCHVEFTKIDNGFLYGAYTEGSVPFPMKVPPNSSPL